ncbi:MAG: HAD family hydrolase [bacterium]|nr:HAD family hydrolase [bacterium]
MALWKITKTPEDSSERPAIFLDRDGVLVKDCHYLSDPEKVEILPGVVEALKKFRQAGFLLIGVSNQSGLGRKMISENEFHSVMVKMDDLFEKENLSLDAFYFCPHAPDDHCQCRKPLPGMLQEAGQDFSWAKSKSWVIGDKESDVALGRHADLGAILVKTGYGEKQKDVVEKKWQRDNRVFVVEDLAAAVEVIFGNTSTGTML